MNRYIHAIIADTHAGHRLGLCNPNARLGAADREDPDDPDAHPVALGPCQKQLWPFYLSIIEATRHFANGDPVVLTHLSDLTHGAKHPHRLMSAEADDQVDIAYYNMLPWFDADINLLALRLITGTISHHYDGSSERLLTNQLRPKFPKCDIAVVPHSEMAVGGLRFDLAHHGPTAGMRLWLEGNQARYYLRDRMLKILHRGETPPHVFARAHYHEFIPQEHLAIMFLGKLHTSWFVLVPPLCGITEFGRRVAKSPDTITLGAWLFEALDGTLARMKCPRKVYELRRKETIP